MKGLYSKVKKHGEKSDKYKEKSKNNEKKLIRFIENLKENKLSEECKNRLNGGD